MTSLYIRHRRLLSADRRLGSQLERDVLAGRAQRHAQGWRDNCARDQLDAAHGIVHALVIGGLVWVFIAVMAIVAVQVLG